MIETRKPGTVRRWFTEDDQFIIDNEKWMTPALMAHWLGRPAPAVQVRIQKIFDVRMVRSDGRRFHFARRCPEGRILARRAA